MEVLHIRSFLPQLQLQINHPDSDARRFQQHWKLYMELAVTPCRALTHEVQQFTVGQYRGLLLPAVPAPHPEVTTWEQDRALAVSAWQLPGLHPVKLTPPSVSTHVNTPDWGLWAKSSTSQPELQQLKGLFFHSII